MLGYSEEELLRLTFLDVTHPDDREVSADQVSAGFAGELAGSHLEKRYVRKDGEIIWALVNWAIIPDGEGRPLHTVASVQDITARKRAEEALRKSERRTQEHAEELTANSVGIAGQAAAFLKMRLVNSKINSISAVMMCATRMGVSCSVSAFSRISGSSLLPKA